MIRMRYKNMPNSALILMFILTILNYSSIQAQEYYTFYLPVLSCSELPWTGEPCGFISLPDERIKLDPGAEGPLYSIHAFHDSFENLGQFKTSEQDAVIVPGKYNLNEGGKSLFKINSEAPTLVELKAEIPLGGYRSLFFEMLRNAITFTDVQEEEFYISREILLSDSPELEHNIIIKMLKDIIYVAGEMRLQMESPLIEDGIFGGKDLFTSMEASSEENIKSFLRYVEAKPEIYRGSSWKISETYATWLVSSSPLVQDDVFDLLHKARGNEEQFQHIYQLVKTQTLLAWMQDWKKDAAKLKDAGNLDKAEKIYLIILNLGIHLESNVECGWANFGLGQVAQEREEFLFAKSLYLKALNEFETSDDLAGLLATGINLGNVLNKMEEFSEGLQLLKKTLEIVNSFPVELSGETRPTIALMYRNLGDSYAGLKQFEPALETYRKALDYTDVDTSLAWKRKALIFFQIAEAYENLGDASASEEFNRLAVQAFRKYEDMTKEAKKM